MKFLLDTHIFFWWCENNPVLGKKVIPLITNASHEIFVSTASLWELIIKEKIGKLRLPADILQTLERNKFKELSISLSHLATLRELPLHHRDPFDRLLIAQSKSEHIPILTRDKEFGLYHVEIIWA